MTIHQPLPRWTSIKEEHIEHYSIFDLYKTSRESPTTGRTHSFLRIDAPDWVNVIAVTETGQTVLVEQYRNGTDDITLEIPGGAVDPDELPEHAAMRELEEETGFRSSSLELLGIVETNPAFLSNRCFTYLATGCRPDGAVNPDPSEEIRIVIRPLADLGKLIVDGIIRHSLVVSAHHHLLMGLMTAAPWTPLVERWLTPRSSE
ncbi:MAG: NUDIX hydrolase [bacterium]|nr:NUDIX hydrolase [bacterium]